MNVIEYITKDIGWDEFHTLELFNNNKATIDRLRKIHVSDMNIYTLLKRDADGIAMSKKVYRGSKDD